jgi:hypothetical protein
LGSWAVVIGVDDYGGEGELDLSGAVRDAELFRKWVLAKRGGAVPKDNLRFLTARTDRSDAGYGVPTRDTIVAAINDVIDKSGGAGEEFYFFFAGHGLTAWVANREEPAILTPGFDPRHPEHSLAIRSLLEFFETLQFQDQFFFIDACRNAPKQDFEIGRWPVPRRREPGSPPVQQFVLYATSPGLTAAQDRWETIGEFTKALMHGLDGDAKAWSWDRNCYEVRWEKLATYVKDAMEAAKIATKPGHKPPPEGWPIQIPQDAGSRGVEGRQRDALLATIPRTAVPLLELTIKLEADPPYEEAEVSVLDAVAAPVASAHKVTGDSHVFTLPPKTYAVLVRTGDKRYGRLDAPINLYNEPLEKVIDRFEPESPAPGGVSERVGPGEPRQGDEPGTIVVEAADPLTVIELRDDAGRVLDTRKVAPKSGAASFERPAGFYGVRVIGPEGPGGRQFVVLDSGEEARPADPRPTQAAPRTVELAEVAGGEYDTDRCAVGLPQTAERLEWAAPSTIVAVALGAALTNRRKSSLLASPIGTVHRGRSGVAFYGVEAGASLDELRVRIWGAGAGIPPKPERLEPSEAGTVSFATPAEPGPHWLSIEHGDAQTVLALPVLVGRLAAVIAEFRDDGPRVYQFHPRTRANASSTPERLRRIEHLERLLLGGRIDGAQELAKELAAAAPKDPFAAVLAGYALLRIGVFDGLAELADAVLAVAPGLCDAYILRGEYAAHGSNPDLAARDQAFAQAVNAGIPIFGEGLTRLVEGLRVSGLNHPRGALVRHIFQQHARGLMWAAFKPLRPLAEGRLVISGSDLGYEG